MAAIAGAQLGKHTIHRIAVREPALGSPERKAVVEGVGELIGELDCPVRAAVDSLVDAKIGGVVADGQQVGDPVTDSVHITELQALGPGHHRHVPGAAAIGGNHVRAAGSCGPHHA